MKKLISLALVLMLTLTLGASAIAEGGEPVNLVFWHTCSEGGETDALNAIIEAFQAENPNITVEAVSMPYDGLKQQVILAAASASAPDVMRMDIIWVAQFAEMGILAPLTGLEGWEDMKAGFYPGPLSTCYFKGDYYGLPMNTNTLSGAWNKTMLEKLGFAEIPTTYDEIIAAKDKLGEGEYLMGIGGANTWCLFPYFYSLGGRFTDEAYTVATGWFNSEKSVNAIKTLVEWYDNGYISPALLGETPSQNACMFEDKALLCEQGPWLYTTNIEADLEHVIPGLMPVGEAGSVSVVGGEDLVMFSSGSNNEAAWKFMRFMASDYAQTQLGTTAGLVPTVEAVAKSEAVVGTSFYMPYYAAQLEGAQPRTPSANWEQMSEKLNLFFEGCFRHEVTDIQAEMDALAAEMDALLSSGITVQ